VRCPRCQGQNVRRSARSGALERLLSVAFVYPFRCQRCAHRFHTQHWRRYPHPKGERRDYERVMIRLPGRLTAGAESADVETTDLSVGGCAVRTAGRFAAGASVRFTVRLGPGGKQVEIAEAIVRAAHEGRISLQFVHVGVDAQRRLAEFIHGIALPIGGRPRRARRLPLEMALAGLVGLAVILLLLSFVGRIGTPFR
jgi:hypothetical protein